MAGIAVVIVMLDSTLAPLWALGKLIMLGESKVKSLPSPDEAAADG